MRLWRNFKAESGIPEKTNGSSAQICPRGSANFTRWSRDWGARTDIQRVDPAAYEINDDFDQSFAELSAASAARFMTRTLNMGATSADSSTIRLLWSAHEIRSAAQYLSLGGSLDHVLALALVGFLMEPQNHDSMLRAVKHMNDGGDVASAYYAAEGEVFKDHSPQCQQTM